MKFSPDISLLDVRVVPSPRRPCSPRFHLYQWQHHADISGRVSCLSFLLIPLKLLVQNVNKKQLTSSAPDERNTYAGCWETARGTGLGWRTHLLYWATNDRRRQLISFLYSSCDVWLKVSRADMSPCLLIITSLPGLNTAVAAATGCWFYFFSCINLRCTVCRFYQ